MADGRSDHGGCTDPVLFLHVLEEQKLQKVLSVLLSLESIPKFSGSLEP